MARTCKYYAVCDYRNDTGRCPDRCIQYKHRDAVIVVRCKDCKYWVEEKELGMFCGCWGGMLTSCKQDDFCSYGERKDNG